jgi:hypothetical protein
MNDGMLCMTVSVVSCTQSILVREKGSTVENSETDQGEN